MRRLVTLKVSDEREGVRPWAVTAEGCPMCPQRACAAGLRKGEDSDMILGQCEYSGEKTRGPDGVYIECGFSGPGVLFATSVEAANGDADGSAAQD